MSSICIMVIDMNSDSERFDTRDSIQIAVGSLAGALIYAYQADVRGLSDNIPLLNILLIVLITLLLSFLIDYKIGVRKLGLRKMRKIFGLIPTRIVVHYLFALIFSITMLWLLGIIGLGTPLDIVARRIIVLSLPATLLGSTLDLVESQRD